MKKTHLKKVKINALKVSKSDLDASQLDAVISTEPQPPPSLEIVSTLPLTPPGPIYKKPYLKMRPPVENSTDIICLGEFCAAPPSKKTKSECISGDADVDVNLSLVEHMMSKSPTIPLRSTPLAIITNTLGNNALDLAHLKEENEETVDEKPSFVCSFCKLIFEAESKLNIENKIGIVGFKIFANIICKRFNGAQNGDVTFSVSRPVFGQSL